MTDPWQGEPMSDREPVFARLRGDIHHAEHAITTRLHHHELPSQAATSTEATMKLAQIEQDIRNDVTSAQSWITQVLEKHLPVLAGEAAKAQASPVLQALEAVVLPAGTEDILAKFITDFAAKFGGTPAVPVTTAEPAAPAGDTTTPDDGSQPAAGAPQPAAATS